jgi:hypothetical protein
MEKILNWLPRGGVHVETFPFCEKFKFAVPVPVVQDFVDDPLIDLGLRVDDCPSVIKKWYALSQICIIERMFKKTVMRFNCGVLANLY